MKVIRVVLMKRPSRPDEIGIDVKLGDEVVNFTTRVSPGQGQAFVNKHFAGVEFEVVDLHHQKVPYSRSADDAENQEA